MLHLPHCWSIYSAQNINEFDKGYLLSLYTRKFILRKIKTSFLLSSMEFPFIYHFLISESHKRENIKNEVNRKKSNSAAMKWKLKLNHKL